ncbi:MAG: aldo/keto reductase [Gammaproteobacteria bacterium]|nr:aldo/keto reductase [Gammaproteobacteria bacterium]
MGGCFLLLKRFLGQTNIEVSVLGLGTVKFGRCEGVKYPTAFSLPSDADIQHLLALSSERGINLLDTAPAYGTSEERLGQLLSHRQQWVISTKVGEEFIDGQSQFDFSPLAITSSIERSLTRLKTDYLDIVLIHSNGEDEYLLAQENIFSTLAALKKAGKIRAYGMSTKTITGGLLALAQTDVAMVTFHPEYTAENDLLLYAHQHQKGILIKKALASGYLSAEKALPFILAQTGVTSVIVGTINPLHLENNINIAMNA